MSFEVPFQYEVLEKRMRWECPNCARWNSSVVDLSVPFVISFIGDCESCAKSYDGSCAAWADEGDPELQASEPLTLVERLP